jgi:DNA-binding LytR/AlgR family response regulator
MAVWDVNRSRGLSLKERLDMFAHREAALYAEGWNGENRHDVFFLSFDECGEPVVKTARSVRLAGKDTFLLLVSDRGRDIAPVFRPKIRPSGILFRPVRNTDIRDMLDEIISEVERLDESGNTEAFVFKSDGVSYRIPFREIMFFEASNKKVQLHTTGQEIGYYDSIENLAAVLPPGFIRCHRSFIVNVSKVNEIRGTEMELRLSGGYRIPFSRSYRNTVKQSMAGQTDSKEG